MLIGPFFSMNFVSLGYVWKVDVSAEDSNNYFFGDSNNDLPDDPCKSINKFKVI